MERHEWKPEITVCCLSQGLQSILNNLGYYPSSYEINPKYCFIDISANDKTRLSGIPFSYYLKHAWTAYENGADLTGALDDAFYNDPTKEEREQYGVFLKPGKVLELLDIQDNHGQIAAKLQAHLLELSCPDTSEIQVTYKPSEVYSMLHKNSGSIGSSCMKSADEERFYLYDALPDTFCAFIAKDNILLARALMHKRVFTSVGKIKVMDRIYAIDALTTEKMKYFARINGYYIKKEQKLGETIYISPSGETVSPGSMYINANLEGKSFNEVPYIDTFCYYKESNDTLNNSSNTYTTCLQETNGTDSNGYFTESKCHCCCCDYTVNEDGAYYNDNGDCYCGDCYYERYFHCERCSDGTLRDDGVSVGGEYMCQYCADHYAIRCEECGDYHVNDEITTARDRGGNEVQVCDSCLENRYAFCEGCDEYHYYRNVQNVTVDNEKRTLCDDCREEQNFCDDCNEYYSGDTCQNCEEVEENEAA